MMLEHLRPPIFSKLQSQRKKNGGNFVQKTEYVRIIPGELPAERLRMSSLCLTLTIGGSINDTGSSCTHTHVDSTSLTQVFCFRRFLHVNITNCPHRFKTIPTRWNKTRFASINGRYGEKKAIPLSDFDWIFFEYLRAWQNRDRTTRSYPVDCPRRLGERLIKANLIVEKETRQMASRVSWRNDSKEDERKTACGVLSPRF